MIIPALANHLLGEPFPANTWLAVRLQEDELPETLFEEARAENLLPVKNGVRSRIVAFNIFCYDALYDRSSTH